MAQAARPVRLHAVRSCASAGAPQAGVERCGRGKGDEGGTRDGSTVGNSRDKLLTVALHIEWPRVFLAKHADEFVVNPSALTR